MENLGSGDVESHLRQLDPQTAQQLGATLKETFVYALSTSLKLSATVAVVGIVIALTSIEGRAPRRAVAPVPAAAPAE
jgi:energy-converting hydrogenase Eha subunit B